MAQMELAVHDGVLLDDPNFVVGQLRERFNRQEKKVLRSGAEASAVVLERDMGGLSNSHGENRWKLRLRVQFDEDTTSEVTHHAYSTLTR